MLIKLFESEKFKKTIHFFISMIQGGNLLSNHGGNTISHFRPFSWWVLFFIPASMVQIHFKSHYFTIVDAILVIFSILAILTAVVAKSSSNIDMKYLGSYVLIFLTYIGIISLGFVYADNKAGVIKEFGKWAEIFLISIGTIFYVKNCSRRFANLYWALFFTLLGILLLHLLKNVSNGNFFARMWAPADWAVIISLPFLEAIWIQSVFLLILFYSLILSYSRLSWASAIVAIVLFMFLAGKKKFPIQHIRNFLFFTISIWGIIIFLVPNFKTIITNRIIITFKTNPTNKTNPKTKRHKPLIAGEDWDQSAFTRKAMIKASFEDLMHHPILGVGAGNFKSHILSKKNNINFWLSPEDLPNSPHNVFFQVAAELGLPGLFVFSILILSILYGIKRGYAYSTSHEHFTPYCIGMLLFTIPLFETLLSSNIGEFTRVIWGLYFGLAISMINQDYNKSS